MSEFNELVERATVSLKRDRELRLEVSRELASHLEASAAEFRAADYDEQSARAEAIKAFGDPDDVAQQLWDANRFRLRLRAWAWGAARLTLLPACGLALVWFVWTGVAATSSIARFDSVGGGAAPGPAVWAESRMKNRMSAEQRLIYYGDESAASRIDRWRTVRDAYPDEVLHQLELISAMLSALPQDGGRGPEDYAAQLDALRVELERGAAMDPDNGVYALIRAGIAVRGVEYGVEDEPRGRGDAAVHAVAVERLPRDRGESRTEETLVYLWPSEADPSALAEAMRWLEVAAEKPYVTMRVSDRTRHRLAQLPPPRSMQEYMMRVSTELSTLLPSLGVSRRLARAAGAEALRLADAGDAAGAIAVLDRLGAVTAKTAAAADSLVSLFVAWSVESLERSSRVAVWRMLGDETRAQAALAESDRLIRAWRAEWVNAADGAAEQARLRHSGVLMSLLIPAIPGYAVDTTPFRKAEYTMADRGMLTLGLVMLVVGSGLASLAGLPGVWRKRKGGEAAVLLWIGWRRLARVLVGAVGLPVVGFVAWSWTPWAGRGYGLNYSFASLVWYVPLFLGVLLMLWRLGSGAMRRRAVEVGLPAPGRRGWGCDTFMAATVIGLTLTLWSGAGWASEGSGVVSRGGLIATVVVIVLTSGVVLGYGVFELAWVRGWHRPGRALLRGVGVGAAATLGVGVVAIVVVWGWVDVVDRGPLLVLAGGVAVLVGGVTGLLWVADRAGDHAWFGRSVLRSMGPVLAAAGLALAVTVGLGLNLRERALATTMVEVSPVWLDQEIEQSSAKVLRAFLAGDEEKPPRLVP